VLVEDVRFEDINQTGLHVAVCMNVAMRNISTHRVGWSGLGAVYTSNLWISGARLFDCGLEDVHSSIHIAMGTGIYVDAVIERATGNGVMLDAADGPLSHCEIHSTARDCQRGLAVIGHGDQPAGTMLISGSYSQNRNIGVMLSNARGVVLSGCDIRQNGEIGLLLQGRAGGTECLIASDCDISGNAVDISEMHFSESNWVFEDPRETMDLAAVGINNETVHLLSTPKGVWREYSVDDWFK
jgi:hypothetical protein